MREEEIPDDLRPLAFEFFYAFSRFEFALKANGYLKSETVGDRAEPSWTKFTDNFEGCYVSSAAAASLIAGNPRRELVGKHGLVFGEVEFEANASELKRVVRFTLTVRNNLFHGGKSGSDGWDDPARMRLLLEATIPVLNELAELGGFIGDYRGEY